MTPWRRLRPLRRLAGNLLFEFTAPVFELQARRLGASRRRRRALVDRGVAGRIFSGLGAVHVSGASVGRAESRLG